ncbi:MAG TPA: nicotinate phosphoribosyltransferase [Nitrososphaerales archaeon]|nr:nicotinate phosphoribosyltransferase [Nitrososphaerales archaeon]
MSRLEQLSLKRESHSPRDLEDRLFWISRESEIKEALTTDVYFQYAVEALDYAGINPRVTMEVYTRKTPFLDNWAVVCGVYEVAKLLEGLPIDVDAMEEGEVFLTDPQLAMYEPVMRITGKYTSFARFENPILGFLCQSSGICTKAARVVLAAQGKIGMSFGTRRAHPALAPMIERSSYIGGVDSVSNVLGAKLLRKEASGTMPHAFILCVGDEVRAWEIFDEAIPKKVPRIVLVDTLTDEKVASIRAFETLGSDLYGVRLDTPSSRRGDLKKIVQEVRWELEIRGGKEVKIFVSGGLDEAEIVALRDWVDGFGVGTSISTSPVIDYGGKIVALEDPESGKTILRAKRGDLSGVKNVFRDSSTFTDVITLQKDPPSSKFHPLLQPLVRNGEIARDFISVDELRNRTVRTVSQISKATPKMLVR